MIFVLLFYPLIFLISATTDESVCGIPDTSPDLSPANGGKAVRKNSFPWHVHIDVDQKYTCGGALVSPQHVLTAAQCVTEDPIYLGLHNSLNTDDPSVQLRKVRNILVHPRYNPDTRDFDIAVLLLNDRVEITNSTKTICLATKAALNDTDCYVTGFGDTDEAYLIQGSQYVWQIFAPYLSYDKCKERFVQLFNYTDDLGDSMCCAGGNGGLDPCPKHAGGPLVCFNSNRWELQGLFSWAKVSECRNVTWVPGLYVNVAQPDVSKWLGDNTGYDVNDGNDTSRESDCGNPNISPDLSLANDGKAARKNSFPWHVRIETDRRYGRYTCGGALISTQHVLTAASCIIEDGRIDSLSTPFAKTSATLYLGYYNILNPVDSDIHLRKVQNILVHPRYNPNTMDFDIAILLLNDPVEISNSTKTICLAYAPAPDDTNCFLTGFGAKDEAFLIPGFATLQQIRTPFLSFEKCKGRWHALSNGTRELNNSMCCAGGKGGMSSCVVGDSGGPLVCFANSHWELHGLLSWVQHGNCGNSSWIPGVYVNVPQYDISKWIRDNTGYDVDKDNSAFKSRERRLHITQKLTESFLQQNKVPIIVGIVLSFLLLICIIAVITMALVNRNRNFKLIRLQLELSSNEKYQFDPTLPIFDFIESGPRIKPGYPYCLKVDRLVIDRKNLITLGDGNFGVVLQVKLRKSDGTVELVALKRSKSNFDVDQYRMLYKEICLMTYLGKHPNIVNMIGCVVNISHGQLYMVMELCTEGSLDSLLESARTDLGSIDLSNIDFSTLHSIKATLNGFSFPSDLISYAYQIATAMEYLAKFNFIHRDLAARNILLSHKYKVAKIADFGLSHQIYKENYKVVDNQNGLLLPTRWTAPESLIFGEFSSGSDVWSFGVLIGEIFTLGEIPFAHVEQFDPHKLLSGEIKLNRPQLATDNIYQLMSDCCNPERRSRPTFSQAKLQLSEEFQHFSLEQFSELQVLLDSIQLEIDNQSNGESAENSIFHTYQPNTVSIQPHSRPSILSNIPFIKRICNRDSYEDWEMRQMAISNLPRTT